MLTVGSMLNKHTTKTDTKTTDINSNNKKQYIQDVKGLLQIGKKRINRIEKNIYKCCCSKSA